MRNRLKLTLLRSAFILSYLLLNTVALAQPPGGPPPGGGGSTGTTPPCWEPECVPIDGGLVLLIIAGAALGAKLLYGKFRQSSELS